MRLDEEATVVATEEASGDERARVCESVPWVCLSVERATPSWALEGVVELVERPCFFVEHILVPLDGREAHLGR
jgi:hypothetical protein